MAHKKFRIGWLIGVLALAAMACTCGALTQAQTGLATAQALATQAQGLATEAVALATQVEESGLVETAQALSTQNATPGSITFGDAPDDIPVYEPNVQVIYAGGAFALTTEAAFADVVSFYKAEMPDQGWTLSTSDPGVETDAAVVLYYTKDGRKATLSIASGASSGTNQTVVSITLEGG